MIQIYERYPELMKIIRYINENNPSNNLPYHGIDHLFVVFETAHMIYNSEFGMLDLVNELELYVAALFHDYNHSGGKLKDSENITNAINGLRTYVLQNGASFNVKEVEYLIRATEFPYTVADENLTVGAKILRDADMGYMIQNISIVKLFQGLRVEFGKELSTFIDEQFKFYDNMNFYMASMREKWEEVKVQRYAELTQLKNV